MVCMQTAPLVPTPATRDEISSPPSSSDGTDVPLLPNRTSFPSVFNFPTLATPFRDLGERITGSFQPTIQFFRSGAATGSGWPKFQTSKRARKLSLVATGYARWMESNFPPLVISFKRLPSSFLLSLSFEKN